MEGEKDEIKTWLKGVVHMSDDMINKIVDEQGYCVWDDVYVLSYATLTGLGFKALDIDRFLAKVLEKKSEGTEDARKSKRMRSAPSVVDDAVLAELDAVVDALNGKHVNSIVNLSKLSAFIKTFGGGMPSNLFIRLEMVTVWDILRSGYLNPDGTTLSLENSVQIILGSPGVGKTVLFLIFILYASFKLNLPLCLVRCMHLGEAPAKYWCVNLSGVSGQYSIEAISDLKEINTYYSVKDNVSLVLDGFKQQQLSLYPSLENFRLLCTSAQFNLDQGDKVTSILLPPWQYEDVEAYHVILDPGVDKVKLRCLYNLIGGSMRLLLDPSKFNDIASAALSKIAETTVPMLLGDYGTTSSDQIDRIRMTYVKDRNDPSHYTSRMFWVCSIDSKYIARQLLARLSLNEIRDSYNIAKQIGGKCHGNMFEYYCHKVIQSGNVLKVKYCDYPFVEGCKFNEMEVYGSVIEGGTTNVECMTSLKRFFAARNCYWIPLVDTFEDVDAFFGCVFGTIWTAIALQYTVASKHGVADSVLKRYYDVIGTDAGKLYIAIVPSLDICKNFILNELPLRSTPPLTYIVDKKVGYVSFEGL